MGFSLLWTWTGYVDGWWKDGWMGGWMDGGWTDRWMDACMDGRKDGWMVKTLQRENPNDQTSPCKKRLSTVRRKNFLSPLTWALSSFQFAFLGLDYNKILKTAIRAKPSAHKKCITCSSVWQPGDDGTSRCLCVNGWRQPGNARAIKTVSSVCTLWLRHDAVLPDITWGSKICC